MNIINCLEKSAEEFDDVPFGTATTTNADLLYASSRKSLLGEVW